MKHNKNPSFTLQKCHILLGLLWCTKFPLAKEYLQKSGTKTHVLTKKEQSYEDYRFKNIAHMFIYPNSLSLQNQRVEYLTILKYSNGISLCMHAKSLQLCPTLCDPMDGSPPGSSVRGILHARILEWATMPSSRGSYQLRDQSRVSCISYIAGRFFTI